MSDSAWLSETRPEGSSTAILVGPLSLEVIRSQAEAFPRGILWLHPSSCPPPDGLPPTVAPLSIESSADTLTETLDKFLRLDYDHAPAVKAGSRLSEAAPSAYGSVLDQIVAAIDSTLRARRTRKDTGVLRQELVFRNLSGYLRSRVPEDWRGSAAGNLAVVVGAGPSLDVTLPLLKDGFPEPVIVAADSALSALRDADMPPHFTLSLDPEKTHASCAPPGYRPGHLILSSQAHPEWAKLWGEETRYLSGRVLAEDWLAAKGIPKTNLLAVNNAGLAALLFADFLEPLAILLVGMDLAAGGSGYDRYAENTGRSDLQVLASHLHQVPGNFSETVPTPFLSDWSETSETCAGIAAKRPVVNLNDRGARLQGADLVHPKDADELRSALAQPVHPYRPDPALLGRRRGLSGPALDQALGQLASRCDQSWSALRPLLLPHASPRDKLNGLRSLLADSDLASLFGDYAFAVMPEIAPGKEPSPDKIDLRLRELRQLLWRLEDAIAQADPSDTFLRRFLTQTFA